METARNGSSMRGSARFSGSTTGLITLSVMIRHPTIGRCRKYLLFSIKMFKWTTRLNIFLKEYKRWLGFYLKAQRTIGQSNKRN
jgi:hypothetical protein